MSVPPAINRTAKQLLLFSGIALAFVSIWLIMQDNSTNEWNQITMNEEQKEWEKVEATISSMRKKFTTKMLTKSGNPIGINLEKVDRIISPYLQISVQNQNNLEIDLYVIPVASQPSYVIAVPDIQTEGVGRDIYYHGILEEPTFRIFRFLLEEECASSTQLVVDLGANFGVFTTYAAVLGCRVISVEAQPRLIEVVKTTLQLNSVEDRVKWHNNIIHSDHSAKLKITYNSQCWACSYVQPANPGDQDTEDIKVVSAVEVDDIVRQDVLLLKIDIEGFEIHAIRSAKKVLRIYNVKNIVIEWNFKLNYHSQTDVNDANQVLNELHSLGYTIRHYDLRMSYPKDGLQMEEWPILGKTWQIPPEKFDSFNQWTANGNREANLWLSKS